jgi:hypothetical protein
VVAVKFTHTFVISTVTALVLGGIFYLLSVRKSMASSAYTANDTYMGMVFVVLLALIIGLAMWPGLLEK